MNNHRRITVQDITSFLERDIPLTYQEAYDNSGLLIGDPAQEVTGLLASLDCTLSLLQEAVRHECNLVITHHPLIFHPIKQIIPTTPTGECITYALKNNLAIYALHTNFDNVAHGLNQAIGKRLALQNVHILSPKKDTHLVLTTFVPTQQAEKVRHALAQAGAGSLGHYQACSFSAQGLGRFKPSEHAKPYIGTASNRQQVSQERIEVIVPRHLQHHTIQALRQAHPYENPVYHLQPIVNHHMGVGSGMIGFLEHAMPVSDFLARLKECFSLSFLRHTPWEKPIQKVAFCGGAGGSLLAQALAQEADAFVTADVRYHSFLDVQQRLLLVDMGHYESEIISQTHIQAMLARQFSALTIRASQTTTNSVKYYC